MFTGIVQGLKPVARVEELENLRRFVISLGELAEGVEPGASVAINGTCLTATAINGPDVSFDVIHETLTTTNLGDIIPGQLVNVERSFRVGDEVGGHILSGHISGVATLAEIQEAADERNLRFTLDPAWVRYVMHKGFVALDGASLTIAELDRNAGSLTVCLIPETIERTTLGRLRVGQTVNVEVDSQTQAIVDTVERVLAERNLPTAG